MKIAVAGCGKIGLAVIESLVDEDRHEVTVIDSDSVAIEEVKNQYDVRTIYGNCTDVEVLDEACVNDVNLFIALTGSDETNMLACFLAKKFGASSTVARIRDLSNETKGYEFMVKNLNIDYTFNPEKILAREIYNCICLPNSVNAQFFSSKKLEMTELTLRNNSRLNDVSLKDIHKVTKAEFVVCSVMRDNKVIIPWGDFALKSGDRLGITATHENLSRLFRDLGLINNSKKGRIIIFGGSRTAYYLARIIHHHDGLPYVIDKDKSVCDRLATSLNGRAEIVFADGSRKEVLHEYGLNNTPAFIALTGFDEENILISYYAKECGVPTVVSKVNSIELSRMAEQIGVENVINPKFVVSDLIKKYVRGIEDTQDTKIETIYSLFDGNCEAVEFIVGPNFRKASKPISELGLRKDINIAGIVRENDVIIPSGRDTIEPGDRIVIVAKTKQVTDLNSILA